MKQEFRLEPLRCGTPQTRMSPIPTLREDQSGDRTRHNDSTQQTTTTYAQTVTEDHGPGVREEDTVVVNRSGTEQQILPLTMEESSMIMPVTEWQDREVEVLLDSGACVHVLDAEDAPGYMVSESIGSRHGHNFLSATGERIPNEGQMDLRMEAPVGGGSTVPVVTNFQVASISKPLMSVGKVCDQGHTVVFSKDCAKVLDSKQRTIAQFQRSQGGLYVASMTLKAPEPFTRQAL